MRWFVWVLFVVCMLALGKLEESNHSTAAYIALVNGAANFWSLIVLLKYRRNPEMVPDFFVAMNWISSLIGIILFIYAYLAK